LYIFFNESFFFYYNHTKFKIIIKRIIKKGIAKKIPKNY